MSNNNNNKAIQLTVFAENAKLLRIIDCLVKNEVRFYLDNNIISGNLNFIFHERHIEKAQNLFPDLLVITESKTGHYGKNRIGKIVVKGVVSSEL